SWASKLIKRPTYKSSRAICERSARSRNADPTSAMVINDTINAVNVTRASFQTTELRCWLLITKPPAGRFVRALALESNGHATDRSRAGITEPTESRELAPRREKCARYGFIPVRRVARMKPTKIYTRRGRTYAAEFTRTRIHAG